MHSIPRAPRRARLIRTSFCALSFGALLLSALAACSSNPSSGAGTKANPEQLTLAIAWTGTQAAGVPPLLKMYNQEHPDVHWNLVENVTEQKLLAEEAAGDAPSAAMLDTTNLVASMATTGAILPLQ